MTTLGILTAARELLSDEADCPECGNLAHDGECYSSDGWFLALSDEEQDKFIADELAAIEKAQGVA